MNEIPEGMKALLELLDRQSIPRRAVLPGGPLFPLLRALGVDAKWAERAGRVNTDRGWLIERRVTGPLADACLAAAEVPS